MNDSIQLTRNFRYVSEVYETCATMLQSADSCLHHDYGFSPYDWEAIYSSKKWRGVGTFREWLPKFVVRQYYRPEHKDHEVLTLGALLWDEEVDQALSVASFMKLSTVDRDEVYQWGLAQGWTKPVQADGSVREIEPDHVNLKLDRVSDGKILSVATPLTEITETGKLLAAVKPLLQYVHEKH